MSIKIMFNREENDRLEYLGKNSGHICEGIEIMSFNPDEITIYPIHSKGGRGLCFIQVAKENIQELIDELEKLK